MSDGFVEAHAYVVLEGQRRSYNPEFVKSAKATRVTQKKPNTLVGDEIAVRVTFRIPAAAFNAIQPQAIVDIPEDLIQHPIEAVAT